jgi:hypothetical protein
VVAQRQDSDEPSLPPVESSTDPALKVVCVSYEKNFGKVISPVKVHSARPARLGWVTP